MASYQCRGKKKLWSVRFDIIENGQVVTKRLSEWNGEKFPRKKDAEAAYREFIQQYQARQIKSTDKIPFVVLYEEVKAFKKGQLKESSYYDFASKCDLHILPYFEGCRDIKQITPKILVDWQSTLAKYSFKYKTNLRNYLYTILGYAERYYGVINQLKFVDTFKNNEDIKEMQVWSLEEFNAFIKQVTIQEFKAFFYALYYTGARKGELLATNWKDWDLKNGTLNITKTFTKKVYDKPFAITKPKNKQSIRKISLPKVLIDIMQEHYDLHKDASFVFCGDKPFADSSIGRVKDDACKKAEVKNIRIHDFRHSHASYLFSKGITPIAVAKRLGHKDIKETFNTYAHMMPLDDAKLLNALDDQN